jgi:hypothetical protein
MTLHHELLASGLSGHFANYRPRFTITEFTPGSWWVMDGDVQVGLLVRGVDFAELVNFDPHDPRRGLVFPRYYHAPTQPGDRVTLAKWVNAQATTSDTNTLAWEVSPEQVAAVFTETRRNGRTAFTRLTWRVDPDFGYVLHGQVELRSPEDERHEFCNFLPRGATDNRPEFARYPFILWEHPDGPVVRWNQNNISARALGALDVHDRRRIKTGGFLGFFGEPDRNSAIEILACSPGVAAGTCPAMLDEHLVWVPREVEPAARDEDGLYRCTAEYRLLSVPPAVGDRLTRRATPLDLVCDRLDLALDAAHAWCATEFPRRPGTPKTFDFPPFVPGQVTDFETRLDPAATFRGNVFPYLTDSDEPVSIVSDVSHSGRYSLRVRVNGERRQAGPYGVGLHVTEGQPYRLSAWVKTDLRVIRVTSDYSIFIFPSRGCHSSRIALWRDHYGLMCRAGGTMSRRAAMSGEPSCSMTGIGAVAGLWGC